MARRADVRGVRGAYDELQFEANKRHQLIPYRFIDVRLDGRCAEVTIGGIEIGPENHGGMYGGSDWHWLYIKDASGWTQAASLGGAFIN